MDDTSGAPALTTRSARGQDVSSILWLGIALLSVIAVLSAQFLNRSPARGLVYQNAALGDATLMFIVGLVGLFGPKRWRPACRTFPLILAGAGLLFIAAIVWNKAFIYYFDHTSYRGEIFRNANYNLHAPLYGRPVRPGGLGAAAIPIAIAIAFALFFARRPRERLRSHWLIWQLALFQVVMTGALGYYSVKAPKSLVGERMDRIMGPAELEQFSGPGDLLRRYVSMMPQLPQKARHYPPGTALLVQFEMLHGPRHLVLMLALILPALCLLPLNALCRELGFTPDQMGAAMILYATSASILVFPMVSLVCMTIFLLATCIWLLVRGLKRGESSPAIALGVLFAIYTFCTFATYMAAIFMTLVCATSLHGRLVTLRRVLIFLAIGIGVYVAAFWVLYLVSGFNIVACFRVAVRLHLEQTGSGFSGPARYLLRSTGGILAFLIAAGIPLAILASASVAGILRQKRAAQWAGVFCISTLGAMIVAGCSGMSFLETERIWLFFCVPLAVAAGCELGRRVVIEGTLALTGTILLALANACCYGIFFEQMLGRLPT